MRQHCIVGLFCRFLVVDRDLEVEEVETSIAIEVPEAKVEAASASTRSFRSN